jgi:hypothetical protein
VRWHLARVLPFTSAARQDDDHFPLKVMRFNHSMSPCEGTTASKLGVMGSGDVVEIGLLLPSSWANALVELSKRRRQTVGALLRSMIDRALVDDLSNTP